MGRFAAVVERLDDGALVEIDEHQGVGIFRGDDHAAGGGVDRHAVRAVVFAEIDYADFFLFLEVDDRDGVAADLRALMKRQ
jgi:hypothetical protein